MEHSTHAHPLPHGQSTTPREACPSYASCTIASPPANTTLASPPSHDGLSQQARRLQLRNVGFRASTVPTRRISPLFGASQIGVEAFTRTARNETSPMSAEKRSTYGENLPPSPVNILQELQKSARKRRTSSRPGICSIFQDSMSQAAVDDNNNSSWYNEASNNCSPSAASPDSTMLKLREVSGNQGTPPLSSPLTKHVNVRNVSHLKSRSLSSEATQHIEYLERELALANARNDSDTSPATKKLRFAKMRALAVENTNLRQELTEWHKKYDTRVEDEVQKRVEFEADMKERLDNLESESEMKDARIGELEWELECTKIKIRDAEGLEEINDDLEKRIDVLTNILVRSPTRMDVRSAATSPDKQEPVRRTPRPRSMLSKVPSSPGGVRLSLATVSETAFWPLQSLTTASGRAQVVDDEEHACASPEHVSPTNCEENLPSPDTMDQSTRHGTFEAPSRASTSMRSLPSLSSRPTSLMSNSSFGGAPWGISVLPECEDEVNTAQKKRRMRRFASGSKSLKPLVLPTATNIMSLPISAPVYPSIESTAERDFSDISLDPTTSSLSRLVSNSPTSIPGQPLRRPSILRAQNQALNALEGKPRGRDVPQSGCDGSTSSEAGAEIAIGIDEPASKSSLGLRSRPRSLQKELEEAEITQLATSNFTQNYDESFQEGLIPVTRDPTPESGQILIGLEAPSSKASSHYAYILPRPKAQNVDITPKPISNYVPSASIATIPTKASPSMTLTAQHAHGMFNRLTNLICQTKQDPLILAKRVLSNAWSLNSNRLFGGIGWWLLGVLYQRLKRKQVKCADVVVVDSNNSQSNQERRRLLQRAGDEEEANEVAFDWHHFSAEASRRRTAEHHYRNYGGTWLSPPHVHEDAPTHALPPFVPTRAEHETPHLFPCNDCVEPSSRRSLRLWFHFSLTIVLALGMALKHGPAALFAELPAEDTPETEHMNGFDGQQQHFEEQNASSGPKGHRVRDTSGRTSKTESSIADSGYGSIVFAQTLGPADFENGVG